MRKGARPFNSFARSGIKPHQVNTGGSYRGGKRL